MFELVEMKSVCNISSGGTPSRKESIYYGGDIKWAKISDLETAGDGFIYDTEEKITSSGLLNIRNRIFEPNTLFLAMYGSVGKTAITKSKMSCNQAILGITPKDAKIIDLSFLKYWLDSMKERLLDSARGVALKNLSAGMVKGLKIPLPPIKTQQRIAGILDNAAALRDKTAQLLTEYDLLAQSIFLEMFGDPGLNQKKWKVEEFGKHINVLTDYHANGSYQILNKNVELFSEKEFALMVRTTDLENNNYEEGVNYISETAYNFLEKSKVYGGEIIMNKIGSAGKVYLMPYLNRPVSLGMNAFLLRLSESMSSLFAYYYLTTNYGEWQINKRVKGAVTKTIRKDAVRAIPIPVPPIELQNEFADKIALIEQQKALAKQELQESEDLFNCLLQQAFKGELV